jgi:hypothetical protein
MNEALEISKGEYAPYYDGYIQQMVGKALIPTLEGQIQEMEAIFEQLRGKENDAYAPGKWTAKQVLGHMIDTDRIMTFRALCFARNDQNALPGFDQDNYILAAKYEHVAIDALLNDFSNQRKAMLSMIKTFSEEALQRKGNANQNEFTVRALLVIIGGHTLHHMGILKERYMG